MNPHMAKRACDICGNPVYSTHTGHQGRPLTCTRCKATIRRALITKNREARDRTWTDGAELATHTPGTTWKPRYP